MKNRTLEFYNNNYDEYFKSTVSVDLSKVYSRFVENLPKGAKVIDLGCGSGRDSLYFKNQGYKVTAIDGSKKLASLAKELIGQDVIISRFQDMELNKQYNAIWACASLLHLNTSELEKILVKLEKALVSDGTLYMSFKYGQREYVDDKGRYFNCFTEETFDELISKMPKLIIKEMFKTTDVIPQREDVIWLNIICKKEG